MRYAVLLASCSGNQIRLIDRDPDHELPGATVMRQNPLASAIGKIMLASIGIDRNDTLRQLTPLTTTDRDALDTHLDQIRVTGIATEVDESRMGRSAIAALVLGENRQVAGALRVIGRTSRFAVSDSDLVDLIQKHASESRL